MKKKPWHIITCIEKIKHKKISVYYIVYVSNRKKRKFQAHDTIMPVLLCQTLTKKPNRESMGVNLKVYSCNVIYLSVCVGCFSPVIVRRMTIITIVVPRDDEWNSWLLASCDVMVFSLSLFLSSTYPYIFFHSYSMA